jgi:glycoprotein 6-alpha-L-fucosyltransferase
VGTEAAFHGLDEYMIYVEEYFDYLEMSQNIEQRAIYLATDDPNLHAEAKNK